MSNMCPSTNIFQYVRNTLQSRSSFSSLVTYKRSKITGMVFSINSTKGNSIFFHPNLTVLVPIFENDIEIVISDDTLNQYLFSIKFLITAKDRCLYNTPKSLPKLLHLEHQHFSKHNHLFMFSIYNYTEETISSCSYIIFI